MQLRAYQQEAKDAIRKEWAVGARKTLLVLPTGCGKTIVFADLAKDLVKEGERVLILAHRQELLTQAAEKIAAATGLGCAVEKAESSCLNSFYQITVGSVQSLMRPKRLEKFSAEYFDTIIIDEAHHCLSDSYRRVLEHFCKAKVLGVTATPDRGDMRNLGQFFETLAYEYTLPKAIREGYLSPMSALTVPLRMDLSGVGVQAGDLRNADIATVLDPYLEEIAVNMQKYCVQRKTVVFLPLVATSRKFMHILNEKGFKAAEVNGESSDRAEILKDFAENKYNVLCNSMLLTEGWDCPDVNCVVVLRPTKVRSLYTQMVGRGTRLAPGKTELLILDFLWHTKTHELCHPASLICESPNVARKMTENLKDCAYPVDIEAAEKQASEDVVADRERALAEKLSEKKHGKLEFVDPLQFEMSIQAEDLSSYVPAFGWEAAPPSDEQIRLLKKFGINPDEVECSGKASLLINKLKKRQVEGLSRPKQIRLLERRGFEHVGSWSFDAANKMIARLSANGWRIPKGINPKTYVPEGMEWAN